MLVLASTELDDAHADACAPLPPSLHRALRLQPPPFDTTTVMLVDPVVAAFDGSARTTDMYPES